MVQVEQDPKEAMSGKPYRLNFKEMGEFRTDQINKISELTDRLGRVAYVSMLGIRVYLISEPEMIREIIVRHAGQLHKDRFTSSMFKRMLGQGIVIAEEEQWRQQRKLIQPIFHATHIDEFATTFAHHAQEMCAAWRVGDTIHLETEMMELTLRIICETMFSADIDGLVDKLGEHLNVMVIEAQAQLASGLVIPDWVPLPTYRRQNGAIEKNHELLLGIIHKRQAQIRNGDEVPADLLTMLLRAEYEDGSSMSDRQVLDECMTIFFAGHETTAVGLTWAWIELLQHPDILQRLTDEIRDAVGDRSIGYADLAQMPYLGQVVKESLRLHPPVAAFSRSPIEEFEIDGYHFRPKDLLVLSINTMHQQEEFYPDPTRFDPERFGPDKEQPDRYMYMPFGAGSRICIGNAFATLEMQVVLATMVQSLRLSLIPGQEFVPEQLITLRPRDGVTVRVDVVR